MQLTFLYFDPGTGALIAQLLAAAGAGVVLFYKNISHKIKSVFGKKQEDDFMGDIDVEEEEKETDDRK